MERDIRSENVRAAISDAWRIWNRGNDNLARIREGFNLALSQTQHETDQREVSK